MRRAAEAMAALASPLELPTAACSASSPEATMASIWACCTEA
jgi:hypothetical protein